MFPGVIEALEGLASAKCFSGNCLVGMSNQLMYMKYSRMG